LEILLDIGSLIWCDGKRNARLGKSSI